MKSRIILINNSCPFYGEPFLRTELDWIPNDQSISVFPIMLKKIMEKPQPIKDNIEVLQIASVPKKVDYLRGAIYSLISLFKYREISAIFMRKQPFRNLLKAIKFVYLSESRVHAIARWLKQNHTNERFLFYSYWLYETAFVAARLSEIYSGSKFITRCHGYDLYEVRHVNGYLPYRKYLIASADNIYPISDNGKVYLEQLYGTHGNSKIAVMRLGTIRNQQSVAKKSECITLVSCSNLVKVKRVDRIIDALAQFSRRSNWYHFGDGPLRRELEIMAKRLPDNIEWHFCGSVPNNQIMKFYQDHYVDAFLNVSEFEGIPVSIMEALSFGIPVVATDIGGTHEIVIDHDNGILLDSNFCTQQLVRAIVELTEGSIEGVDNYRARAKEVWEDMCNAEINYNLFYRKINEKVDL